MAWVLERLGLTHDFSPQASEKNNMQEAGMDDEPCKDVKGHYTISQASLAVIQPKRKKTKS